MEIQDLSTGSLINLINLLSTYYKQSTFLGAGNLAVKKRKQQSYHHKVYLLAEIDNKQNK